MGKVVDVLQKGYSGCIRTIVSSNSYHNQKRKAKVSKTKDMKSGI